MATPFGSRQARIRPSQMMGDDRDIFERLAAGTLSNISKGVNVLDLVGSSARDILAGENPFDQWLTPTTDANRTTGRQLLEGWGMLGQNTPGLDLGDVAGLAAEVVADPFFWVAGPSRALTNAGRVAERANILGDVSKLTGRAIGPRAGRISTTLDDVLQAFPEHIPAAERAAEGMGVTLDAIKHERLGGLAAFGPPVGNPWAVFGASDSALPAATVLDNIGSAIRWSPPVRAAYQMFGGGSLQTGSRIGQETANAAVEARNVALSESRHAIADIATELQRKGVLPPDPFEAGNQLFEMAEGITPPHPEVADLINRWQEIPKSIYDDGAEWGVRRERYDDPNIPFYTPRDKAGTGTSRPVRPFSTADEHAMQREDILRSGPWGGIHGGTATLRRAARETGDMLEANAKAGITMTEQDVANWIGAKWGHKISDEYSKWLPQQSAYEQAFGRHQRLAKTFMKEFETDPDILKAGFYTDPLTSLSRYTERSLDINETAKAVIQTIADPEAIKIARNAAGPGAEEVPVPQLLDALKFDLDNGQGKGAIAKLSQLTGQSADDVAAMTVPRELADDLSRMTVAFSGPEPTNAIMRIVDNITGFTKAGQTSIWPAFHVRNLFSGQFRNWVAGMWDPASVRDAYTLTRGGVVRNASEIPIIRKTLQDRGQQVTDEAATDVLREFVYAHRVSGRGQGEMFLQTGTPGQMLQASSPYSTMNSVLGQFPGGFEGANPFSYRQTAKQALGMTPETQLRKPWEIRGFNERTSSTFGPVVAGESIAELTEDINRISPFINQLRQGVDPNRAAEKVLSAQIDYSSRNFSKFETQVAQRVVPYWRFNSRNLPYVAKELFERPGGLVGQTYRAIDSLRGDDQFLPEHIAGTAAIPLGQSPDGTKSFLTGFGLMEEAAAQYAPFDVARTLRTAGSQLNPLLRAPIEWATGRSLFYDRDIDDLDPPVGRLLSNVAQTISGTSEQREPYKLPTYVEFALSNSPISRAITSGRQLTDPRKSAIDRAVNFGTGMRQVNVSPAVQDRVITDALGQLMQESGARSYEKLYFAGGPETPEQVQMMQMMEALRKRQQGRSDRRQQVLQGSAR